MFLDPEPRRQHYNSRSPPQTPPAPAPAAFAPARTPASGPPAAAAAAAAAARAPARAARAPAAAPPLPAAPAPAPAPALASASAPPAGRPGDPAKRIRRKPLQERPPSEHNRRGPHRHSTSTGTGIGTEPHGKPTLRLVSPSPSPVPESPHRRDGGAVPFFHFDFDADGDGDGAWGAAAPAATARNSDRAPDATQPGGPARLAPRVDASVSESPTPANETRQAASSSNTSGLPTPAAHVVPHGPGPWHRRSASSGTYSAASTLKDGDRSTRAPSSGRFSQDTTLRGTPTPTELELRARLEAEQHPSPPPPLLPPPLSLRRDDAGRRGPAHVLHPLQESPERVTIRAVPPSVKSSSSDDYIVVASGRSESDASSIAGPSRTPSVSGSEHHLPQSRLPVPPRRSSQRTSTVRPVLPSLDTRNAPTPRPRPSQDSFAPSEATIPEPSSPIVVIYDSDSTTAAPRSRGSQAFRLTPSIESIQSRLQYPTVIRPETGRTLASHSSWASLQRSSSADTLPPLQVPKKRSRPHQHHHRRASSGSNDAAHPSGSGQRMASEEEVDTYPYPRRPFSNNLSTIASESDQHSRNASQQLSHFSLGSGVLTGDDASSAPLSGTWPRRRRDSAPLDSMASESSRAAPRSSGEDEPGDMTLGIFREESAKPAPLFRQPSLRAPLPPPPEDGRRYDGPFPPLPPIPRSRDSDENFDTVSELPPQSPALMPKRSGYSLRQRSNSTPSRSNSHHSHTRHLSQISYVESDRGSYASSIFPTWAKHFYGGTATLLSASKISLGSSHHASQRRPPPERLGHVRNDSQWTERSITSRLGTGYSELETGSPTSSHILPSIFGPRPPVRANPDGENAPAKARPSLGRPSAGEDDVEEEEAAGRPDSLTISADPLPSAHRADSETLPSGHPKWGPLKEGSPQSPDPHQPLPRQYSRQKQWDQMEFPRPMTKDRLSEFAFEPPHLAPTKRTSYRLSAWQAPSFSESLDTLVRSRGNRQILLFVLGFVCPLLWMLAAVLPLPKRPISAEDFEKSVAGSHEDVQAAMMMHEAGDAERRWAEEKQWLKAHWWRTLNRIMSIVGVLVIGAVIALAVVATT